MKNNCIFDDNLEIEEDDTVFNNNDADVCSEAELTSKFPNPYHLALEEALSLSKQYILHLDAISNESIKVCMALSSHSCQIRQVTESSIETIRNFENSHKKQITQIKYVPESEDLIVTSSLDGTIKLWDIRQNEDEPVVEMKDDTTDSYKFKPITTFDISNNLRLLAAGTELYGSESFILFWDFRAKSLLGGYWETHTDDITHVQFHKKDPNLLASGSTDGLINVYNLKETTEDDALLHTYNTESSVDKFSWFTSADGDSTKNDAIAVKTHDECLNLWKLDDGDAFCKVSRENLSTSLQRKSAEDAYIASIHEADDGTGKLIVIAGSNVRTGECLRALTINGNESGSKLNPFCLLSGNKQIVRTSWYSPKDKIFITGGESSILNIWKPGAAPSSSISPKTTLKSISAIKSTATVKSKPY